MGAPKRLSGQPTCHSRRLERQTSLLLIGERTLEEGPARNRAVLGEESQACCVNSLTCVGVGH